MSPRRTKLAVTLVAASGVVVAALVLIPSRLDRPASTKLAAAERALVEGRADLALRLTEEVEGQLASSGKEPALSFAAGLCRTRALIALGRGAEAAHNYPALVNLHPSLASEETDRDIIFALLDAEDGAAALSLFVWAISSKRGPVEFYRRLTDKLRSSLRGEGLEVFEHRPYWAWASPPEVDFAAHVMYMNGH